MLNPSFRLKENRKRRGFTLTETAVALGVFAFILGSIWTVSSSARRGSNIINTSGDVLTIVSNIRTLYSGHNAFSYGTGTDITTAMVNGEVFPKDMFPLSSSTTPRTAWGTNVKIYVGDSSKTAFKIDLGSSLPKEVCVGIIARTISQGNIMGVLSVATDAGSYSGTALTNLTPTTISPCTQVAFTFNLKG